MSSDESPHAAGRPGRDAAASPERELPGRYGDRTGPRQTDDFADGSGLDPVYSLDLSRCASFSDLLKEMRHTAFGGRQLGEAADVLYDMVRDPRCLVVGTFSGAMTVAKQGLVLCDMLDHGMIDVVVSTGALMTHGLVEAAGMTHFKVPPGMRDRDAFYAGYDRVYDTLELERNLDDLEHIVDELLGDWPEGEIASSRTLNERIARHLVAHMPEGSRGILPSALRRGVPVYIPAFSDSELGLDFALHNRRRAARGKPPIRFDPFLDLEHYTEKALSSERLGIFTIGGGVPRNWAQQVCPYIDLVETQTGAVGKNHRFRYGVRICPEPVHWGGLSGCTYSEGVSWGKFVPPSEGGRFAEVPADATIAWPLLTAAVLERLRS